MIEAQPHTFGQLIDYAEKHPEKAFELINDWLHRDGPDLSKAQSQLIYTLIGIISPYYYTTWETQIDLAVRHTCRHILDERWRDVK